jgi:alkylhydroperoxidase family enzyme
MKVTNDPAGMEDGDFGLLREVGLDTEEIAEVLEIAAFFSFSNRLATPLAILPDDELFEFQRR